MKTESTNLPGSPAALAEWLKLQSTSSGVKNRLYSISDDGESPEPTETDVRMNHHSNSKSPGACVHCKSLKVRCEFAAGSKICQRCQTGNYECLPRTRKKRKPAPTHEDLLERSYHQDSQIQELLLQFDKLRSETKVKGWISRAHAESESALNQVDYGAGKDSAIGWTRATSVSADDAVSAYFSHASNSNLLPPIVKFCDLFPKDIEKLFDIYFTKIDPFFSLLDKALHTPEKLIWTCPFLFTVICATASRYYDARLDLYHLATDFARDAAGKALIEGSKSVDVCQAYLILSVYPVPKKKWTQDRSWLLMGVAIRMALELELNKAPPSSCDEREALNRTRTWLNCYCVDGSHAVQFGKMPMLRLDDYLAKHSQGWYNSSSMNTAFDVHLCAYVQLIIIMAEWRSLTGDSALLRQKHREGLDVIAASLETANKLQQELDLWLSRYTEEYAYKPLLICAYRGNTTSMITAYLRLSVLAVGFQYAVKSGLSRDSEVFKQSIDAAQTVIQITIQRLYPTGHLRYAMEAHFLYVSFAAAYLVNLLRPRFLPLLSEKAQRDIVSNVRRLINVLGSKEVALDGRHTPALHSRFLSSLLDRHQAKRDGEPSDPDSPTSDGSDLRIYAQYGEIRQHTPPNVYSWPDILNRDPSPTSPVSDHAPGTVWQQPGDSEMDFSALNYIRTVSQDPAGVSFTRTAQAIPNAGWVGEPWPAVNHWVPPEAFR
ncbi:fungal-specific transcription factor domain-containing protein [Mycena floridula]|nr:fungal-specific transcription factor domain-containing protein [Mycena floridula]